MGIACDSGREHLRGVAVEHLWSMSLCRADWHLEIWQNCNVI